MSDFNGVLFTAIEEGWSEPVKSAVSVRGFPGGDSVAISLGAGQVGGVGQGIPRRGLGGDLARRAA
jgi:hypothetical protein